MTGRVIAAALVAAAVVASLFAPFLLGLHAEQFHRQLLDGLVERGYRIVRDEYRRGWLTSRAVVVVAPPISAAPVTGPASEPPSEPTRLQLTSRIDHGPRAGDWSQWPPVLATTRGRITAIGGPRQFPPLLVDGVLAADGAIAAELRMPNVAYSGLAGRLHLEDARGSLRCDSGMRDWRGDGELRRLEAVDGNARNVVVEGLGWHLDLANADVGLPSGEILLELDRLSLDSVGRPPPVALADLRLGLRSVIADGQVSLAAELGVGELSVDHAAFAPSHLRLSLTRVDAPALADLRAGLTALSARDLPASMRGLAIGALMTRSLPALLAREPRLALEALTLMTPKGPVTATAFVELSDGELSDLQQPLFWLTRLSGEARVSAPRALVLQLLLDEQRRRVRQELRHRGEPDDVLPPRLEAEVAAAASAALAALIRDGWLLADGDRLRASAALGDGVLTLNGKRLPIAGFAQP